jgi:hypothetical protein
MSNLESTQASQGGGEFNAAQAYRNLDSTARPLEPTGTMPEVTPQPRHRQEWRVITGAIMRDLPTNAALRDALIELNTVPVSETLPAEALHNIAEVDATVAGLERHYQDDLMPFLEQPPIPEELIGQDLGTSGLPYETITMIAERNREARELKLLGLMAELEKIGPPHFEASGDYTLPSGVHLHIDPEQPITAGPLVDPRRYTSRRILKDRVSQIMVGGRPYVMKERKTNRHTDTMRGGHRTGLTSAEEFALGKRLHEQGETKEGRIHLKWENPLAYVDFPDGHQLMVAEYEPDMMAYESQPELIMERRRVERQLEAAIMARPDEFETEYLAALATEPKLSYDDFAHRMTDTLLRQAEALYDQTLDDQDLARTDRNRGMGLRLPGPHDEGFTLTVIGFDHEYTKPAAEATPPPFDQTQAA